MGEAGEILLLLFWSEEQDSDEYGESSVFGLVKSVIGGLFCRLRKDSCDTPNSICYNVTADHLPGAQTGNMLGS